MAAGPAEPRLTLAALGGPTRIVGGPRAGKTACLLGLAREWLGSGRDPSRLLVVVRSREAAEEFQRRLAVGLPGSHPTPQVRTHEGLAGWVAEELGEGLDPEPLDPPGDWLVMREALRGISHLTRLGELAYDPGAVGDALLLVAACQRALVGPGLLASRLRGAPPALGELALMAEEYRRVLGRVGARDRRDLHRLALERLQARPEALVGFAELLLVDEAEDLSPAQWVLLRELCPRLDPPHRLVLAGHALEAAPGFPGVAGESSSRPFEEYFPAELHPREWRLEDVALGWCAELAHELGLAEGDRGAEEGRPPAPGLGGSVPIRVWSARDETEEASAIAREILRARLAGELEFGEVAVLMPAPTAQQRILELALSRLRIPWSRGSSGPLVGEPVVALLLDWLRALSAPRDERALLQALGRGPLGLDRASLRALRGEAARRLVGLPEVLRRSAAGQDQALAERLDQRQLERVRTISSAWGELAGWWAQEGRPKLDAALLRALLGRTALASRVARLGADDLEVAGSLSELWRACESTLRVLSHLQSGPASLPDWLSQLTLALGRHPGGRRRGSASRRDEVALLSLRQAKGRSWRRVFVMGCSRHWLPAQEDSGGLLDPQELALLVQLVPELEDVLAAPERRRDGQARQFLIALTRGEREVVCSWPERVAQEAAERSPFLDALLRCGGSESASPWPWPLAAEDVVEELALSGSPVPPGDLGRAARELANELGEFDPMADGPAAPAGELVLSATSIGSWLACPRQHLAARLCDAAEPGVALTLGAQAHLLLQLLYEEREAWAGVPEAFERRARELLQAQAMPRVRREHPDPLEARYVELWLGRMLRRWRRLVVEPGRAEVGEPVVEEIPFEIAGSDYLLRGRIDAIWRHPSGELELVDYKTGQRPPSPGELLKELFGGPDNGPSNWQLPIYQLAARAGALSEELGSQWPRRARNWYLGKEPSTRRRLGPIPAVGFRVAAAGEPAGTSEVMLTEGDLDRLQGALDRLAEAVLQGRFPAQPLHDQRTCRDDRNGCPYALWCEGEGSVGAAHPVPPPLL